MGTVKQINIKNRTYYFYNDIIDLENFDAKLLKIDKKSYKDIGIYSIGYVTKKKVGDCMCVCFYSSTVKASSVCKMSKTYLRAHGTLGCEYQLTALCQVPSSPYLKMSYFTSKDENSSRSITGEKTI